MSTIQPDATSDPRFPVGRFDPGIPVPRTERLRLIATIAELPARMRAAVDDLTDRQLDTPYRTDGWTVRQLVHHVADSHMNAYIRFKLALTESRPRIKTYDQAAWAELHDSNASIDVSLDLLATLHQRWTLILTSMEDADYDRMLDHPEWGDVSLWTMLLLYEWHARHHLAHIVRLRERMRW